jgi:TfoX/Sxy family transcriptional regulator of competence genes
MARAAAKLTHVSEAMKQWCAMMESELLSWPQVSAKPMFGMVGFYRKGKIFAAIPRDRTIGQRDAVLVKLLGAPQALASSALNDSKTITASMPKAGWLAMATESMEDVRGVLDWFSQAYELAGRSRNKKATDSHGSSGSKKKRSAKAVKNRG